MHNSYQEFRQMHTMFVDGITGLNGVFLLEFSRIPAFINAEPQHTSNLSDKHQDAEGLHAEPQHTRN